MNLYKNIALLFFLIASTTGETIYAQGNLETGEVEVIKDFDARLKDTEKVVVKPMLPNTNRQTITQSYNIPPRTMQVEYVAPKIRPIAMRGDKLSPAYNGYLKLGGGVPTTTYGELAYSQFFNKQLDVGVNLKHHQANFKNLEHQRFMENSGTLNGTYYTNQGYALGGNIGYSADQVHYYGYDHEAVTFSRESVKQKFNTFDLGVNFFNGERTQGDINYRATANVYRTTDNYAARENHLDAGFGATKWFSEKHSLDIDLRTDLTTYKDSVKQKLNNFYINPAFTFHNKNIKAKIGANLASVDEEFSFYPDVEVSANIVGNKFTAFVGAEGGLEKNSLRSLSDYNPFINTFGSLQITNTDYNHFYGGLRGSVGSFNYKGQVGYKRANNLPLFLNSPADSLSFTTFDVIYDTVSIFNIQGSIGATILKVVDLSGTISVNEFDLNNQEKAWHLPALEANFTGVYRLLEDKFRLKGELYIANGVPYLQADNVAGNLNTLLDVSIGGEYILSENIGAFIEFNNLLNNKRERWVNYETYGINILAGVTAKF